MARAYRERQRSARIDFRRRGMVKAMAVTGPPPPTPAGYRKWRSYDDDIRLLAGHVLDQVSCPVCGQMVWPGVRRRADARYCSPACRTTAWRRR